MRFNSGLKGLSLYTLLEYLMPLAYAAVDRITARVYPDVFKILSFPQFLTAPPQYLTIFKQCMPQTALGEGLFYT
jgi:hypothetical protein